MKKIIALGFSALLLTGCTHGFLRSSSTYTVQQGDTINSIARKFKVSSQDLASYNNIASPYTIRVGQTLTIKNPKASDLPPAVSEPVNEPAPVSTTNTSQAPASPQQTTAPATLGQTTPPVSSTNAAEGITWSWPTQGNLITGAPKGINIAGTAGQPIYAAASGQVVFSGVGSGSYGNMIIIRSANNFLTAYGNNQKLMVKEGQQVARGQQIATMGQLQQQAQLRFEIRKSGNVVNPLSYLPAN
ncbi:MAG: nlpD 1 [Gammaproteobacteria bacterium]|jgi:lipoprotein NlpD|nr:nlpD 1 [Gammaproteobacteria bacterium]